RTVCFVFVGSQLHSRNQFRLESAFLEQFLNSPLRQRIRPTGELWSISLPHIRHAKERHANEFCVGVLALRQRDPRQRRQTYKQQRDPTYQHCFLCDPCALNLWALCVRSFLRNYSPSTVTNSFTDAADFCSAAVSSAVSL